MPSSWRKRRACKTSATVSVPCDRARRLPQGLAAPEREAFVVQDEKGLGLGGTHQRPQPGGQAFVTYQDVRIVIAPVFTPKRPVHRAGDHLDALTLVVTSQATSLKPVRAGQRDACGGRLRHRLYDLNQSLGGPPECPGPCPSLPALLSAWPRLAVPIGAGPPGAGGGENPSGAGALQEGS